MIIDGDSKLPDLPGFMITAIPEADMKPGVDVHAWVLDFARGVFRKRRNLPQTFFIRGTHPRPTVVVLSPQDPRPEVVTTPPWVITMIKDMCRKWRATAVWCASEAWTTPNDGDRRYPSQRADRRECVMVTYECRMADPPMQMWIASIDRCARPKLLHWEPRHDSAYSVDRLQWMLPEQSYGAVGNA